MTDRKAVMQIGPGLKGFVCPPQVPTKGERHEIDYCLTDCQHPCVAEPLIAAIYHANVRNPHKGAYLSASMIAGSNCTRKTHYERLDPDGYYELIRNVYWPFRGTIAHMVIENRGDEAFHLTQFMQEITMRVALVFEDRPAPIFDENGLWTGEYDPTKPLVIVLGGTCDAYSPWKLKLYDFKTMADAKARMVIEQGKIEPNWEVQLNIYRWLISKTEITEKDREEFKRHGLPDLPGTFFPAPETLRIQGIGMMEIPFTGQGYVMQRSWEEHMIPPIKVMPLDEIEALIRERAIAWFDALVLGIKPPVVDKDRAWMCKSCCFNGEVIPGERCFPGQEREANADAASATIDVEPEPKPKKPRKPRAPKKTNKVAEDFFG
jgi:hypothetical protein